MKFDSYLVKPEELLSHRDFVGSLARNLIHDVHKAEDLAQDTLLAALENPPKAQSKNALRAWFSKVTRNLAFRSHRRECRRMKRERASALPTGYRSTVEVLERENIRRNIVEEVMNLKEPYRSAILYRYYDELTPMEIAERLETPIDTVKTHIQRGLKLLRKGLNHSLGKSHKNWILAVAPLAGVKLDSTTSAAVVAPTMLFGGLVMATKVKFAVISIIAIGAIFTIWRIMPDKQTDQPYAQQFVKEEQPKTSDESLAYVINEEDTNSLSQSNFVKERIEPNPTLKELNLVPFKITVLSLVTKEPVSDFQIIVKENISDFVTQKTQKPLLDEIVKNSKGRFTTNIPFNPNINISVKAPNFAIEVLNAHEVHEEDGLTDLLIYLEPGINVEGIVIDHKTNLPVCNSRVISLSTLPKCEQKDGYDISCYGALTQEDGRFLLTNIPDVKQTFVALHPDYAEGLVTCRPTEFITISLMCGFTISGHMRKDDGTPCAGGTVTMADKLDPFTRKAIADSTGLYKLPPAAPGEHLIYANGPLVLMIQPLPPNSHIQQ